MFGRKKVSTEEKLDKYILMEFLARDIQSRKKRDYII